MINLRAAQNYFRDNWPSFCRKEIREMWFLKEPGHRGEIVITHHILDKRMKMVFGKRRMSQPDPRHSCTVDKFTKETMENKDHMNYVNGFKKIMDTKTCPRCGRTIDAIELKLMFTEHGALNLLHFSSTPYNSRGYSYQHCTLNEKEFYDLQLNPQ